MSNLKLYEIADEYRALLSIMDLSDEEDIDGESFRLALQDIQAEFSAKATNIACLIKELTAEAKAVSETAKNLQIRERQLSLRAERLRDYLQGQMQTSGLKSVADARVKVLLKANPPSVRVESPDLLSPEYCRFIPARWDPDKTAIKAALKAGSTITGCTLVQTQRLEIQ